MEVAASAVGVAWNPATPNHASATTDYTALMRFSESLWGQRYRQGRPTSASRARLAQGARTPTGSRGDGASAWNVAPLKEGDVMQLEYASTKGTVVRVNRAVVVSGANHDLMLAFLDHLLGQRPVSETIKRVLLGGS